MTNIINPGEKHMACVLLVDASGSMGGRPIAELNEGLRAFGEALQEDTKAAGCTDICVISFDKEVHIDLPFTPAEDAQIPELRTSVESGCAMNEAIITGLDMIEAREQEYKSIGVDYWKPWMFLMTDGVPTDDEYASDAKDRLQEAFNMRKINFFPIVIGENADAALLRSYTKNGRGKLIKTEKNHIEDACCWMAVAISPPCIEITNLDYFLMRCDLHPEMPVTMIELYPDSRDDLDSQDIPGNVTFISIDL